MTRVQPGGFEPRECTLGPDPRTSVQRDGCEPRECTLDSHAASFVEFRLAALWGTGLRGRFPMMYVPELEFQTA